MKGSCPSNDKEQRHWQAQVCRGECYRMIKTSQTAPLPHWALLRTKVPLRGRERGDHYECTYDRPKFTCAALFAPVRGSTTVNRHVPGLLRTASFSSVGCRTALPSTSRINMPGCRPARAAGLPGSTSVTFTAASVS